MRTMAPRVHLLWCAIACAPRSTAERVLADPASFVVVQGLWLPPETAEADAAPQADALPVEGFHGINSGHGLGWLRSATQNRLYAEGLGGRGRTCLRDRRGELAARRV